MLKYLNNVFDDIIDNNTFDFKIKSFNALFLLKFLLV